MNSYVTGRCTMGPMSGGVGRAGRGVVGSVTRGTTNINRLRRVDRWLVHEFASRLRAVAEPTVVDLGFGGRVDTAVELTGRLRSCVADVQVWGLEISPDRVASARAALAAKPVPGLQVALGGFELGPVQGRQVHLVRAANVLRQYDEADVAGAWSTVCEQLAPGGALIDLTCDELGRRCCWVTLGKTGPVSLSISVNFGALEVPSDVAERLPKVLIHRNVPGERVHDFLVALDAQWHRCAPLASWGMRQRWVAMCAALKGDGWPILGNASRWRLGELSVAWSAVAPRS